jgi:hypothetical protein
MKIIALSGKRGVGKSTLANLICQRVPGAVRMSFAGPLYEEVAALLGIPVESTRAPFFKGSFFRIGNRGLAGREVLQWWGTDIRRAADPDYLVKRMAAALGRCAAPLVVIDDVRFRDEADFVEEQGGRLYRLDPFPGWRPDACANHPSETGLDLYNGFAARFAPDFGGLPGLADQVVSLLARPFLPEGVTVEDHAFVSCCHFCGHKMPHEQVVGKRKCPACGFDTIPSLWGVGWPQCAKCGRYLLPVEIDRGITGCGRFCDPARQCGEATS